MAKLTSIGFDVISDQCAKLSGNTEKLCKAACYAGAEVMADAFRREIGALRTVSDKMQLANYRKREAGYLSDTQQAGLLESLGITPISSQNGVYNAKVGFDGYNGIVTRRWPKGQPNVLIARACESGSSAMLKQPFARKAINGQKKRAQEAMGKAVNEEIDKITGGT